MSKTLITDARDGALIDEWVTAGDLRDGDKVVKTRLHLIEAQRAKLADLRATLIEGEESGPCEPFDFEAFLDRPARTAISVATFPRWSHA